MAKGNKAGHSRQGRSDSGTIGHSKPPTKGTYGQRKSLNCKAVDPAGKLVAAAR